jgi:hypothetical protein
MDKDLMLFEEFEKKSGEKISQEEFKNLRVGAQILYMGKPWIIEKNDDVIIKIKRVEGGETASINYSQFNQKGAISI